jgi:hypothetical protein
MPYGNLLADVVQGSIANTPPQFKDGNGTEIGTLCRAWVNFNGTGTVAIRASFNVSSITDRGTGKYTVNFTTAMPDANYCINGTLGPGNDTDIASLTAYLSSAPSTSSVQINSSFGSGFDDRPYVLVTIFR